MAGLAALAVAMGIGRFAFTPILPMMQEDGVVTIAAGGWLAAANYLGYLVGALSAVAIRMRPGAVIRAGLLTIVATTAGMGLEHRFAGWVVLRATSGFASAWILISVSAWALARLAPLARPLMSGAVFAGVGVGIAETGLLTLLLMYWRASAAQAWIALGCLAFLMMAAAWPFFTSDIEIDSRQARPPTGGRFVWSSGEIRLVLCYGAFGFGYIIPATFLPAMARDVVQDRGIFGWAWPVFGGAAAISPFVGGLSRGVGTRGLWAISQFVMALGICLPVIVPGLTSVMLAALCVGGTFMVITMAGMQEARAVAGPDATSLMAAMTTAFAVGQIMGPVVVSYSLAGGGHLSTPLLVAAGTLGVSACLLTKPRR